VAANGQVRIEPPKSRAGLRKISLHDSRHTTLSLMEKAKVPISVISKWAGHLWCHLWEM